MKECLIGTFKHNDATNKKLLTKISQLQNKNEAMRLSEQSIEKLND
jgi:hypothetical protein